MSGYYSNEIAASHSTTNHLTNGGNQQTATTAPQEEVYTSVTCNSTAMTYEVDVSTVYFLEIITMQIAIDFPLLQLGLDGIIHIIS